MSTADASQAGQPAPPTSENQQIAQQLGKDELLSCQWNSCGEKCSTPEQLYDHICERHVGRKSTNNLNLTCGWGTCRTTTVKRDHITSHIRVHVPLKPHKCDFCGKAFKRPQDLKKHVKTHADDSVLLRSPDPHAGSRRDPGYRVENGKAVITDLQALAATATGYYENPMQQSHVPNHAYGHHGHSGNPGYYGNHQQSYGPVYYAVNHGGDVGHQAAYDSKKRGYEALNDFFGEAKRRQIDPNSYSDVGQRLLALQGIDLPVQFAVPSYQAAPAMVDTGGSHGTMSQSQYVLPPMPNLRTKNDLMNIDQFLEQMQTTVYESSNQIAAAGVAQPDAHYIHGDMQVRHSHSPPQAQHSSVRMESPRHTTGATAPGMVATSSQSTHSGTPALTPPSSSLSYTSGHSPVSLPSVHGMSPLPRTTMPGLYPNLPAVSAAGDVPNGYAAHAGATPTMGLGPDLDHDQPRRYSGGRLQSARKDDHMDTSDDAASTPEAHPRGGSSDGEHSAARTGSTSVASDLIDPALSGLVSPSHNTDGESSLGDTAQETWVENIRVIENLRKFIAERLDRHEYDNDNDDEMTDVRDDHEDEASKPAGQLRNELAEHESDAQKLYPVLRAVEAAD
ncbi:MAG: hypothetical protein M1837_004330 [Sclerophora amabilis]|nr:MAG: hypothetical protein M1837_004330 [Sclerophora amabilis]